MKEYIAKLLTALGLSVPADKVADYDKLLLEGESMVKQVAPPARQESSSLESTVQQAIEAAVGPLRAELENVTKVLGDERTRREAAEKALADSAQAESNKRVNEMIEAAIKDGRIKPGDEAAKANYLKLAMHDFDATKIAIEALPLPNGASSRNATSKSNAAPAGQPPATATELREAAAAVFSNN